MAPDAPRLGTEHVAVGRGRREDVGERSENPADEVEDEVPQVSERVLDVVSEDPEIEHVAGDVGDAAVHEHGEQEGQVDRDRSELQPRLLEGLAARRIPDRVGGSHHVLPADDLLGDRREGVGEPVVSPHSLQKHEHRDVRDDQEVVDERGEGAVGIVVADRNHAHSETSPSEVCKIQTVVNPSSTGPNQEERFAETTRVEGGPWAAWSPIRYTLVRIPRREEPLCKEGFVQDIEGLAVTNDEFRRVLYTARHCQLVVMALKPKEEIGAEVHKLDQFFRVEEGTGEAVLDGVRTAIRAGFAVVVPAGTNHNIINTGSVPLKLYTLYAPPNHRDGVVHHTRARRGGRQRALRRQDDGIEVARAVGRPNGAVAPTVLYDHVAAARG